MKMNSYEKIKFIQKKSGEVLLQSQDNGALNISFTMLQKRTQN